jgi:DGQHR domain-containing protein
VEDADGQDLPEGVAFGTLVLPENATLWLVDGQHRVAGLKELIDIDDSYRLFPVPAIVIVPALWSEVMTEEAEVYEEAKQFVIINRTQKGVRSDLAERFLARILKSEPDKITELPSRVTYGIEWVPRAIEVAEILNKESTVWKGGILMPNDSRTRKTVVSQRMFTQSLRSILTTSLLKDDTPERIAAFLDRYWEAIKELVPEAFDEPALYVIQKTTGVTVLNDLFTKVLLSVDPSRKLTVQTFKELLSKMQRGMTGEFWSSNGHAGMIGTSGKAFASLATELKSEFEEVSEAKTRAQTFQL